jgi:hypothetical protein
VTSNAPTGYDPERLQEALFALDLPGHTPQSRKRLVDVLRSSIEALLPYVEVRWNELDPESAEASSLRSKIRIAEGALKEDPDTQDHATVVTWVVATLLGLLDQDAP